MGAMGEVGVERAVRVAEAGKVDCGYPPALCHLVNLVTEAEHRGTEAMNEEQRGGAPLDGTRAGISDTEAYAIEHDGFVLVTHARWLTSLPASQSGRRQQSRDKRSDAEQCRRPERSPVLHLPCPALKFAVRRRPGGIRHDPPNRSGCAGRRVRVFSIIACVACWSAQPTDRARRATASCCSV